MLLPEVYAQAMFWLSPILMVAFWFVVYLLFRVNRQIGWIAVGRLLLAVNGALFWSALTYLRSLEGYESPTVLVSMWAAIRDVHLVSGLLFMAWFLRYGHHE